jgi:hypothetical protein
MRGLTSTLLACWPLIAAGCGLLPTPTCDAAGTVRVYQATQIKEQWINFLWVEIPASDAAGTFPGRLFVASANPMGAVVPSMIDLPCEVSSSNPVVNYVPAPVEIEFDGAGGVRTSYAWKSCARCSECYMLWDFELDIKGRVSAGSMVADVVLNETFHQHPMQILSLKLPEVTKACTQPHTSCRAGGECSDMKFDRRP